MRFVFTSGPRRVRPNKGCNFDRCPDPVRVTVFANAFLPERHYGFASPLMLVSWPVYDLLSPCFRVISHATLSPLGHPCTFATGAVSTLRSGRCEAWHAYHNQHVSRCGPSMRRIVLGVYRKIYACARSTCVQDHYKIINWRRNRKTPTLRLRLPSMIADRTKQSVAAA
jgi:hypothetical protein